MGAIRKMMVLLQAVYLAASPLVSGAAKSHSTSTQYRQLRRLSFIPCLFSLLVTVKLKPEIISQRDRELIVNMTILET